ncbi:MAG: PTS system mannose/fructose/N-acetylgalactosamine-transporter subunit IIB [Candidatus Longimicrobiales bacterium M2_2A_002]
MPVVLYRVDERLIHGQVIVGWGTQLEPDRIVVVDDALAESPWEQELYAVGVPVDMTAEFTTVETAVDRLPEWQSSDDRIIVLTRDIQTMLRLAETGGLEGAEVNIGGVHHEPGRRRVLRYVFLGDREREALRALEDRGARVAARDVPGARRVGLDELVGDG